MRQYFLLKAALALCRLMGSTAAAAAKKESMSDRMMRLEFVEEMERIERENTRRKSQETLRERLLHVAKEVFPQSFFLESDEEYYERKLDEYNGNNYNQNNYNNGNNNDDYMQNYIFNNNANIDLAGYALKYVGCQNVHTWDDNLADGSTNPLAMNRFVIFRLCKANDCSAYNKWGCNYNYGEYVIPMEDYLSIMAEYHFEQFGRFCKTCYRCMHLDYYNDDDGLNDDAYNSTSAYNATNDDGSSTYCDINSDDCTDDEYWAEYRKYWGERRHKRNLENYNNNQGNGAANYYYNGNGGGGGGDDNYQYNNADDDYYNNDVNKYPWYADQYGKCIFEEVCSNFRSVCRKYDPDATHYEDYFSCTAVNFGGAYGYLGPHCRSDGRTIGIGVYKDNKCNDYTGDTADITTATGMSFDDGELKNYYDKNCISCTAEEGYSLITDDVLGSGKDLTYPLCTLAYQVSGKCDRHMSSSVVSSDDYVYFENQQANEESVCNFIESLVEQNYDERGEVVLRSRYFNADNWQNPGEYVKVVRAATPFQRFALSISMVVFFALMSYAAYLTKKLVYRKPWRPPASVHSPYHGGRDVRAAAAVSEAGRLSRGASGIVALRSLSDAGSVYNENASMANSQLV